MKIRRSTYLLVVLILGCCGFIQATHNRAGEITYEQIDDLTIRATITTYTRTSSVNADRDSLELFWGDGTSMIVDRANGSGEEIPNTDVKINYYIAEHTYPTRGTYTMATVDPNRVAGILNIDFPNSVNIQFYIQTTFTILDSRFQGRNSSAILLQPPIDFGCVGEVFTHNPNAYDPDGDSLSYEFAVPFQDIDVEVPNYLFPNEVSPGPENNISLDPITGDFIWESPPLVGEYNITLRINEYRNGQLINSIIRDMQILVRTCMGQNNVPVIETIDEICVIAGETISFDVIATDIDTGELITLSALGGPLELEGSPAKFIVDNIPSFSPANGVFTWETNCSHIRQEFYQVVFKAEDNFFDAQQGLVSLRTVRIKITAPPPENVMVEKVESAVRITWDNPYQCDQDIQFQGFSVWRRLSSKSVTFDACRPGLEGQGYEKVIILTEEVEDGRYVAFDPEVGDEKVYCYRVVGEYAQVTESGRRYNPVQSIRSEEACVRFDRRDPLITRASIETTDASNGSVTVEWELPDPLDVDTIFNPGPYAIQLTRFVGGNSAVLPESRFESNTFAGLIDTAFLDSGINTANGLITYVVSFFTGNSTEAFSSSDAASTVLLNTAPNDESINVSWDFQVPWNNFEYVVFQQNDVGEFEIIDSTNQQSYTVEGLTNGEESCFKVLALGTYSLPDIEEPLINFSQEVCAAPSDFSAPCPPMITVQNLCNSEINNSSDQLLNQLRWSFNNVCMAAEDLVAFNIYFAPLEGQELEFLSNISSDDIQFDHFLEDRINGCYAISAIDQSGNESELSEVICVDNCPSYELANTFTPNNDSSNDIFVPRINRFIDRIDMEIYNRWGQLVFETEDPAISWAGTNQNGSDLANGTYYYTCRVFESRVDGVIEQDRILRGFIQLVR